MQRFWEFSFQTNPYRSSLFLSQWPLVFRRHPLQNVNKRSRRISSERHSLCHSRYSRVLKNPFALMTNCCRLFIPLFRHHDHWPGKNIPPPFSWKSLSRNRILLGVLNGYGRWYTMALRDRTHNFSHHKHPIITVSVTFQFFRFLLFFICKIPYQLGRRLECNKMFSPPMCDFTNGYARLHVVWLISSTQISSKFMTFYLFYADIFCRSIKLKTI